MYVCVNTEPRSYEDVRIDPVVGPFETEERAREYGFMYCQQFHIKELQAPPAPFNGECPTCESYRVEYNVAIANGLVMKAQSVTARWGGHNRTAH